MELMDFAVLGVAIVGCSAFFSLISSFAVAYIKDLRLEKRINALEKDLESLEDSVNGRKGQEVKHEKNERLQNSLIKAGLQIKKAMEDKMPPEQMMKELAPKLIADFAMENPDVAIAAAKKNLRL